MEGWVTKSLGEVTSIMTKGVTPKYADWANENTIVVLNQKCNRNFEISFEQARFNDCSKKSIPDEKILRKYDVLINSTGTGTAGRVAQLFNVDRPMTIDGHMILLRSTDEIDPIYYGYAVKKHQAEIELLAEGSTGQTEINRNRLSSEIMISFPQELSMQRQIGKLLYQIDQKINNNICINNNLEQQTQAIFTNIFIANADTTWPLGHLSDLITVRYGKDHKKLHDGVYPVYGSGGIMRYVERPLYDKESVLIPRKGTLNNVIYVNKPFWSVDTMFFTEMKQPNIAKFVFHFVKSKDLASLNAGSAVPSMTTDILNAMELYLPDAKALSYFESLVTPMYLIVQHNTEESKKLENLRNALLPKLMSGELDVSNLDL